MEFDGKKVIGMGEALKMGLMIEVDSKNFEGLVVSKTVMEKLSEFDFGDIPLDDPEYDRIHMFMGELMPTIYMRRKALEIGAPVRANSSMIGEVWILVNDLPGATIVSPDEMQMSLSAKEALDELEANDFDYDFDDDFDEDL